MADAFELIFQGDQELLAYFASISQPKKQRAIMAPGHTGASGIIKGTLRSHTPRLTGLLKRSIGVKRYSPSSNGESAAIISVIGPRSSIKVSREEYIKNLRTKSGKKRTGGREGNKFIIPEEQQPARYAARAEEKRKYTFGAAVVSKGPALASFSILTDRAITKHFRKMTAGKRKSRVR